MATELMLQLWKDGEIVGYEVRVNGYGVRDSEKKAIHIAHLRTIDEPPNILCWIDHQASNYIPHDSFEQGIKQDDGTWWFERS